MSLPGSPDSKSTAGRSPSFGTLRTSGRWRGEWFVGRQGVKLWKCRRNKIIARCGSEYGPEAIRRLEQGLSIVYEQDGILIRERPDRRRFAIRSEVDGSATILYELE